MEIEKPRIVPDACAATAHRRRDAFRSAAGAPV
jgi:hypothetical protein